MQVETAILECIKDKSKTIYRIAKDIGISWDTTNRHLWRLKSEGKVGRVKSLDKETIKWAKAL